MASSGALAYHRDMDSTDLEKFWDAIIEGDGILGWRGYTGANLETLVQLSPHRVWARKLPTGRWEELRPMEELPPMEGDDFFGR